MSPINLNPSSYTESRPVTICKFSELNKETQEVALSAIASLNRTISTDGNKTDWSDYTELMIERLQEKPSSQSTFFLAQSDEKLAGYSAFYTEKDEIAYPSRFINASQAYCSWTAVKDSYRGNNLAIKLKISIFEPEHNIESFRGHVKKTNSSSLRILEKFEEMEHKVSREILSTQILYTVYKKDESESRSAASLTASPVNSDLMRTVISKDF